MSTTKTTAELLGSVPLLSDLDAPELEEIGRLVQRRYYARGETLIKQGLPDKCDVPGTKGGEVDAMDSGANQAG